MQEIQIWHNPKCSKSRAAMELLENKNIDASVVKYLEQTPTKEQLIDVLKKLNMKASQLLRTGEDIYKELNLKDEKQIISDLETSKTDKSKLNTILGNLLSRFSEVATITSLVKELLI